MNLPKFLQRRESAPTPSVPPVPGDFNNVGANNLFGSIAGGVLASYINQALSFYPLDSEGKVFRTDGKGNGPQWLNLYSANMQKHAYKYCSPLSSVIDKLAEADTNGIIRFVDEKFEIKENFRKNPRLARLHKLFKKPNPLQTWKEFDAEQVVIAKTHGYCPVFVIRGSSPDKTMAQSMWNLDPTICTPVANKEFNMYDENARLIEKWQFTYGFKSYDIPADDVIVIKDGYITAGTNEFGLPISKVAGLDYAVSNICAAMEADNVLLKKKGPLGIFSFDPKPDVGGWNPMATDDKAELQKDLGNYGLSVRQLQYIIARIPIKWNPVSFNAQELQTKETIRQSMDFICDRLSYPAELMSGKNATYENRNSSERYLYQNNIIPFSLRRMETYTEYFDLGEDSLWMDFSQVYVLQDDVQKEATARKEKSTGLDKDWKNDIITMDEYRAGLKMAPVGGSIGSMRYTEYQKSIGNDPFKNTPAPKKGSKQPN